MAASIRQRIVSALDARLKTILKSNGYETDVGRHVYEWRDPAIEVIDLPAIVWRDTDCDDSNATIGTVGYHLHSLKIELEIHDNRQLVPGIIRTMIADVTAAIGTDTTWGGLAIRTNPISHALQVEQAEKLLGLATLTFTIEFYTKKWNPYS